MTYPEHLSTLIRAWAVPEEIYQTIENPDITNYVPVEKGTVGKILMEGYTTTGLTVTIVRFPGNLIAELGPTAWVAEYVEE